MGGHDRVVHRVQGLNAAGFPRAFALVPCALVMSVRMRLKRTGKRKQPSFRVVVADQRSPRDGRNIEELGTYNPLTNPSEIRIDEDKALAWLAKGAQPSLSVIALLRATGIWQKFQQAKKSAGKAS